MPFSAPDILLALAPAIPLALLGWCLRWLMAPARRPQEVILPARAEGPETAAGHEPVPQRALA